MEVHRFMQTYPGTVSPLIRVLEDHYAIVSCKLTRERSVH
jgi:hypothetical protein